MTATLTKRCQDPTDVPSVFLTLTYLNGRQSAIINLIMPDIWQTVTDMPRV